MTKLTLEQQELLFANDCKLINLRYEYHGYTGTEKWAIVTELAEEELWVKYPDVIRRYTPFILLSMAQGEVITEYQNYEARERMRRLLFGHVSPIYLIYNRRPGSQSFTRMIVSPSRRGRMTFSTRGSAATRLLKACMLMVCWSLSRGCSSST